jgi:hypothetical protein
VGLGNKERDRHRDVYLEKRKVHCTMKITLVVETKFECYL